MYRIVCKFVPSIRFTPTGGQFAGSWRVVACMPATAPAMAVSKPVMIVRYTPGQEEGMPTGPEGKYLVLSSPSRRQPNSWCSPRKILEEWLAQRRLNRTIADWVRVGVLMPCSDAVLPKFAADVYLPAQEVSP